MPGFRNFAFSHDWPIKGPLLAKLSFLHINIARSPFTFSYRRRLAKVNGKHGRIVRTRRPLLSPESRVASQESGLRSQGPGVRSQESGARGGSQSQESGLSGSKSQESGLRSPEPGARLQEAGVEIARIGTSFCRRRTMVHILGPGSRSLGNRIKTRANEHMPIYGGPIKCAKASWVIVA